jgi:hypothetical protein
MKVIPHSKTSLFAIFMFSFALVSCGGGSNAAISARGTTSPGSTPVAVTISPTTAALQIGAVQSFTATVTGATDTSVTWTAAQGTIVGSGATVNYTAPLQAGTFVVTARSNADPTKSASAQVTVTAGAPQPGITISMNPSATVLPVSGVQNFTATVTGATDTSVVWTASQGTITSAGVYTAPNQTGTFSVTATSVANPLKSVTAVVNVISVTISPTVSTIATLGQQNFTLNVVGSSNVAFNFTATGGGISGSGTAATYTASTIPGTFTVTATAVGNPSISVSATVNVIAFSISPSTVILAPGSGTQIATFNVNFGGSPTSPVTFSVTPNVGSLVPSGSSVSYTASTSQGGTFVITAALTSTPTVIATATVKVAFSSHGLAIPTDHPRLWWTPSRFAAAQNWAQTHQTYLGNSAFANFNVNKAWQHVVQGADCSSVITEELAFLPSYGQTLTTAFGSDDVRANGEVALVVFDWCYDQIGTSSSVQTTTSGPVNTTGQGISISIANTAGMFVGQDLVLDSGGNQEAVIVSAISGSSVTAYNVTKTHASGVPVVGLSQKASFINNWNYWLGNVDQQIFGGLSMPQNNYFTGTLRNDIEWGIVSYGDNGSGPGSIADNFIQSGLGAVGEVGSASRWPAFKTAAAGFGGGVPVEGTEYGSAFGYNTIPFQSAQLMGRDVLNENDYFKQLMFWLVYGTTPAPTLNITGGSNNTAYMLFTWGDDEITGNGGMLVTRNYWQDLANFSSNYFSNINVGKYARQWYNTVSTDPNTLPLDMFVASQDASPPALSFANLPLDYYATGGQYAWLRSAWDTSSTAIMLQMGDASLGGGQHSHKDYGSFSIWRGGRWLSRETTEYSNTIAGTPGINGNANQDGGSPFGHNVPIFTNVALGQDSNASLAMPTAHGPTPTVNRLETQPGYFYADVDLTGEYLWDASHPSFNTGVVGHVEREFLYVRGLETLVVFDRILTGNQTHPSAALSAAQVVTSSITHFETTPVTEDSNHFTSTNGNQVVRQTVLIPTSATSRIINEQTCSGCSAGIGQFRLEVDNSGSAQRYLLNVMQARSSAQANVTASVVDSVPVDPNAGTFTITLHPSTGSDTVIVFIKGQTSIGGSINVAGGGVSLLRLGVQTITYPDTGPQWLP